MFCPLRRGTFPNRIWHWLSKIIDDAMACFDYRPLHQHINNKLQSIKLSHYTRIWAYSSLFIHKGPYGALECECIVRSNVPWTSFVWLYHTHKVRMMTHFGSLISIRRGNPPLGCSTFWVASWCLARFGGIMVEFLPTKSVSDNEIKYKSFAWKKHIMNAFRRIGSFEWF